MPQAKQDSQVSSPQTSDKTHQIQAPAISLPKGGGAIRGIGEKFAANPVTGTGSISVPIATSSGRSNFGPQLSLSYNSGAGNGPFGFGWNLSLPSITRKTDKSLPQYLDATESDVFILSGAEDLVPVFNADGSRFEDTTTVPSYTIHRYRPRIEGLFARIERWTRQSDGDIHWRSISKDNILSIYGKDENSRISNPEHPNYIFSWLICETRDDKGNAVLYEYKAEDGAGVNLSNTHERNRGDHDDPRRTANRYIKHIYYGNIYTLLDGEETRPHFLTESRINNANWMFEAVFDYGEHDIDSPKPDDSTQWDFRNDPFSSYRSGFEVRTTRLCQRVLMFHHFPNEEGVGNNCLVRSTDFTYSYEKNPASARNPIYTFLNQVTQSGYKRKDNGYLKRSLPPVEFEYSLPNVQDTIEDVDAKSLENMPMGLDNAVYQWTDLHGEGVPGILTEQANSWFYKRNLSPINTNSENGSVRTRVKFAPLELVTNKPNTTLASGAQFMDLAGDGQPDLVFLSDPVPGLYEHDGDDGWQPFCPFTSRLNRNIRDPNLKFVDLDGNGHADILITEDNAFVWHTSLAEAGFGPAFRTAQAMDEEKGPRLVFNDGTQSIYLADLSGDGLTDLARIRNGEVCYWPNLGYGRFGPKVTMDNAPWFDNPDQFNPNRIRLADIDGSGTTDIIYLHRDGVRLYFNQSGNSWSRPQILNVFPRVDDLVNIIPIDLLGNGTACLVWSSPLPGDATRPMRYIKLMGSQKPHLLVKTSNNLGAETHVHYAPSTKFYLQDKQDGSPWITRLSFPVHVVEKVETYDHISRSRFVTRYAYHHGYFDGEEREFRGFGMVEQWDTEQLAALTGNDTPTDITNNDTGSHVPPVRTKTWFHTGVYLNRGQISRQFEDDYYREPDQNVQQTQSQLLPDTILPNDLTLAEERDACRALKGMMLRQEVYADDAPPDATEAIIQRAATPYTVVEQNFTIRCLQSQGRNQHAVFFNHPREVITYHYERNPTDPRIQHALTLEVDDFGNVLKEAAIGYGRLHPEPDTTLPLQVDRDKQTKTLITYTENRVTEDINTANDYRTPLPCETKTFELTGIRPENEAARFTFDEWAKDNFALQALAAEIPYEQTAINHSRQKRLIEHLRTLYRKDDLTALLPLGELKPLALPGESYKLAFTPGLLTQVFQRDNQPLLPDSEIVLGGQGSSQGGYVDLDGDGHWWIPAGRVFFSSDSTHASAQERAYALDHFFLPHRYRDPFNQTTTVTYDTYDLLLAETRDPVGNQVTVGERDSVGNIIAPGNDYRVLQPWNMTDPNGNRTQVAFDALGLVVGTAVMGKPPPAPAEGGSLQGFVADLTQDQIDGFYDAADPHTPAIPLLNGATTRIIYDLNRFQKTKQAHPDDPSQWLPPYAATLARETHLNSPLPPGGLRIQISFSYSDGFGREIQKKIQAEPEKKNGVAGSLRWVGSGWTIFNNKGKPVRQYEPFFSQLPPAQRHHFEFGIKAGISPTLFYDPVERVIATLHPNHTYEKVIFDPWQQTTYDVNDTVLDDPRTDADIQGYTAGYFATLSTDPSEPPWQTWHEQREDGALGPHEQAAANKAAAHADTPTIAYFDTLGRPFLTVAHNKVVCPNHDLNGTEDYFHTRVELDIEGNQRSVRDAIEQGGDAQGRIVMRYDYDMLGNRIHQLSMEAGPRWMLNDVTGKPIRSWDGRFHTFRTEYDPLRRPLRQWVHGADANHSDPRTLNQDVLVEQTEYGEGQPNDMALNLRTRVVRQFDGAGVVTKMGRNPATSKNEAYDFKGNLLRSSRQLVADYKALADWQHNPALKQEIFTSATTYDALNRPIQMIAPRSNQPGARRNIIQPGYNEANLIERLDVWLEHPTDPTALLDAATVPPAPVGVNNIDYDAKGQRLRIEYKNGATTHYGYDPQTFRLIHLYTRRGAPFTEDCGHDPPPPRYASPEVPQLNTPCGLQNWHYTYDPAGNITHIQDDAQQAIYFKNRRVEPSNDYTYDAIYRLIEATGREHLGQNGAPIPHSHDDALRIGRPHPNDGDAMGRYCEKYVYDAVGNIMKMSHHQSCPASPSWTRRYTYGEASLIEPAKMSNRLSETLVGNEATNIERYTHDVHGNMTRMPHLGGLHPSPDMFWDYRDQLRQTDLSNSSSAYYIYDANGQRVRKVWQKSTNLVDERIYLGGFEIFRRRNGNNLVTLERETLHNMDGKRRIALIETRTQGDEPGVPQQLIHFQFGNHLGSTSLELDDQAQIISYEEYTPYGSTSYQAVRSQTETPKRYRYTGKERDEESGLYYSGARYYVAWLGRWCSTDPGGLIDGNNLYTYVNNNPVKNIDEIGMQTSNSVDDLFKFILNEAGFRQGQITPPSFQSSSASPFGTGAHQQATGVVDDLKNMGFHGAERIYSEVAVNRATNTVTEIGGSPIRGHHNIDLVAMPEGQTLSRGQTLSPGQAEVVADIKYGRGNVTQAHSNFGQSSATVNSRFNSTASTADEVLDLAQPAVNNVDEVSKVSSIVAKGKTALKVSGKVLGAAAAVGGAAYSGVKIGTGVNKILEGDAAEGSVDILEGSAELGIALSTTAAATTGSVGSMVAGGSAGAVALASVAAGGAVALAAETTRAALKGEKTPAVVAREWYANEAYQARNEKGISGSLKRFGLAVGGTISEMMSWGQ